MSTTELHPELAQCVREGWIKHRLVEIPLEGVVISRVNRMFTERLAQSEQAWANGDWKQYIFSHTEFYRSFALFEVCFGRDPHHRTQRLSDEEMYPLIGEVWTNAEHLSWSSTALDMFLMPARGPAIHRKMMTPSEADAFSRLPDQLHLYRSHDQRNKDGWGWSWTLSRDVAMAFAETYRWERLTIGWGEKEQVSAYFQRRGEEEIIADWRHVRIEEMVTLEW